MLVQKASAPMAIDLDPPESPSWERDLQVQTDYNVTLTEDELSVGAFVPTVSSGTRLGSTAVLHLQ